MRSHRRRERRQKRRRVIEYPIATMAYYGPDDRTATKVAVGIVDEAGEVVELKRWWGENVERDPQIHEEIVAFIRQHGAREVVVTDGILGCPHEEGIDFPVEEDCPFCPFWKGKQ